MGFLEAGTPMRWEDTKKYHEILEYVIEHGIIQFLNVYEKVKDRKNDVLLWGDELEFHIFEKTEHGMKLALIAADTIQKLKDEDEKALKNGDESSAATWHPEYGAWMIEATPSGPYGGFVNDLLHLETNLRKRRKRIIDVLGDKYGLSALVSWPLLGVGSFTNPPLKPGGDVSESYFLPDGVINPHPRFATLTRNIRLRRGKKVDIRLPLFQDKRTDEKASSRTNAEYVVRSSDNLSEEKAKEVYMDAMGFGMGCCCLQVTFQARDLQESRTLYDQLAPLCPIFLALSAGSPIFKGMLVDTDVRWQVIAGSVDDRTPVNLGVSKTPCKLPGAEVPQRGTHSIGKSRYDTIDSYIADLNDSRFKPEYNDGNLEVNPKALNVLKENGIDCNLAKHVAHLFVRDPLVIFSERIKGVDDKQFTEHFENIQSTNWNTMRWKPPGLDVKTGWRVEFRPMEKQLTDFEDAAYINIIVLITRVILFFDLNFYVPISIIDKNMERAHDRNAILEKKFYFRKDLFVLEKQCEEISELGPSLLSGNGASHTKSDSSSPGPSDSKDISDEYEEMTIAEILTGKGENFPGLFPLIHAYLDIMQVDDQTIDVILSYMSLLVSRAQGTLPTEATYIRNFVQNHPDYKQDSIISEKIHNDLVSHCEKISNGEISVPEFLGKNKIIPVHQEELEHRIDNVLSGSAAESLSRDNKRLRGASFHEEIQSDKRFLYRCSLVKSLVEKHKKMRDLPGYKHTINNSLGAFDTTPPFLNI